MWQCVITGICDTHPALILSTCILLPVIADSAAAFLRICPPPSNMLPGTSITSIRHQMQKVKMPEHTPNCYVSMLCHLGQVCHAPSMGSICVYINSIGIITVEAALPSMCVQSSGMINGSRGPSDVLPAGFWSFRDLFGIQDTLSCSGT